MGPKLQVLDPKKDLISKSKQDNSDEEENDVLTSLPVMETVASAVRWRKKTDTAVKKKGGIRTRRFERRYTELGPMLIPEQKRVDYVLVYTNKTSKDTKDPDKKKSLEDKEYKRDCFEQAMIEQGFFIQKDFMKDNVFVKLHCPFKRLCMEAEAVKLEMRLKDCPNYEPESTNFVRRFMDKYLETDDEVDFISAPFLMDRIQLYQDFEDPTHFFRPATRSLLVDHILINLDIRKQAELKDKTEDVTPDQKDVDPENAKKSTSSYSLCACCGSSSQSDTTSQQSASLWNCLPCCNSTDETFDPMKGDKQMQKWGLPYLMMKDVYTDAFILHEESSRSKQKEELKKEFFSDKEEEEEALENDPRKDLDDTWSTYYKFQPLWKIRNYFGEKIALYFAWSGLLISSLWIPTLFGFAIFLFGLITSTINETTTIERPANATLVQLIKIEMEELLETVKLAFDNDVTPFFACVVCLWGTVFLEMWKRKGATLAYEWDVDNYDSNEPDRPQFFGTKVKKDPVTSEENWFYPVKKQVVKYLFSATTLLFMVSLVLASLVGVIVYRVIIGVDLCPGMSAVECLVTTNIVSAILNAVSIILLGKVYDKVAIKLTDWENYRTQSGYDDALIIKLFAFQFANNYASCVYIAFFRGNFDLFGVFGLGEDYRDDCSGTCMSQLSFQVLTLMLVKPFPKMFKDIALPLLIKLWRIRPSWCCRLSCCPCSKNKIGEKSPEDQVEADRQITNTYIEMESLKPTLGDFTLGEYTEKIIQYGFLMLFAASFPLAPLLALVTNLVDIRVDAKRMLWLNRRPVAYIRKDIGRWYSILDFVNNCGVISNGFLIAFTSSWGQQFDFSTKLWIVIIFEHMVFSLKFLLAYLIADVPRHIRLAMRREKFQVAKILNSVAGDAPTDYSTLVVKEKKRRKTRSSNYELFDENGLPVVKEDKTHKQKQSHKEERTRNKGDDSVKPLVEKGTESKKQAPPVSPNGDASSVAVIDVDTYKQTHGIQEELWYCDDKSKTNSHGGVSISGVETKMGSTPKKGTSTKGKPTTNKKTDEDDWATSSSSDSEEI
ncbi:anoctamin-4-like isoform X4 [Mizuhopecten yessoensis]|uniref:anoctamin-4-like isoform X4 n=1 Tax=Mizuhopecten yessoensis TaxID=6573 RepID=UPI000B45C688|nr:anoctamin-4-like isoform X4 [Mizuhopecten yessoensis]